jgi:hypothetical protein
MQLAARRVAWENTQLRDLLADNGVSTEEIKVFLYSREGIAARVLSGDVAVGDLPGNIAAQSCKGRPLEALSAGTPTGQSFTEQGEQAIGIGDHATTEEVEGQVVAGTAASEPREQVPGRSSPTSTSFTADDSMFEMSCQMAAEIISGMRENQDQEQTRSQLGCAGYEQCNVKNITVLQLMAME